MKLPGIVTNVTAFGAFVDVGVHQDGLVHVSQLADTFVKDPSQHVKPGQKVSVTVVDIDLPRNRIALSMRSNPEIGAKPGGERPARGSNSGGRRDNNARAYSGGSNHAPARRDSNASLNDDWFSAAVKKKR